MVVEDPAVVFVVEEEDLTEVEGGALVSVMASLFVTTAESLAISLMFAEHVLLTKTVVESISLNEEDTQDIKKEVEANIMDLKEETKALTTRFIIKC